MTLMITTPTAARSTAAAATFFAKAASFLRSGERMLTNSSMAVLISYMTITPKTAKTNIASSIKPTLAQAAKEITVRPIIKCINKLRWVCSAYFAPAPA
ncbi:hypothetical protein A3F86_06030 [candidate division WOR-1 bacterium RIFCSPLOWO2_12_FULL_45_9]|uniref:Uncharacterized protein n=1 Tax=candidate division WOR-1 bacterium RIFCSPLOWO2_12_FULL_45_9 TaxID=1802568 RepID=A0A1F4RNP3_UNCSA|nr:MAG: hypothetical protein A3F86_06030 [candidate division WOR-1 bacterium RIFCSPLOWO2_12_FULL_45_9]